MSFKKVRLALAHNQALITLPSLLGITVLTYWCGSLIPLVQDPPAYSVLVLRAGVVVVVLGALAAGLRRRTVQRSTGWLPFFGGLSATLSFWHSAWFAAASPDDRIRTGFLFLFVFWLPGMLAALTLWLVLEVRAAGGIGRLWLHLVSGLVSAALAAAALTGIFLNTYLYRADSGGSPAAALADAIVDGAPAYRRRFGRPLVHLAAAHGGRLQVHFGMDDRIGQVPATVALAALEDLLESAHRMVRQGNVTVIALRINNSNGHPLLKYNEAQPSGGGAADRSALWERVQLDRSQLRKGGRLTGVDLATIHQARYAQQVRSYAYDDLQAEIRSRALILRYQPDAALFRPEQAADAWAVAGEMVAQVARQFPDMERYEVHMPGQTLFLARSDLPTWPDPLRLDAVLVPGGQVVVITVGDGHAAQKPGVSDCTGAANDVQRATLLVVHQRCEATALYQQVPGLPHELYIMGLQPDGSLRLAWGFTGDAVVEESLPPQQGLTLAGFRVENRGFVARPGFFSATG